jgi:hypothetical protein
MIDKDFECAGKFLGFDVFEAKEGLEGRVIMTTEIQMRHTDTFKHNEIFTIEDLRKCFDESRLTHPMVGFKHDTFDQYLEWVKAQNE